MSIAGSMPYGPVVVEQRREQAAVQPVHDVVVGLELGRGRDVAAGDDRAGLGDEPLGDLAHLEDRAAQLRPGRRTPGSASGRPWRRGGRGRPCARGRRSSAGRRPAAAGRWRPGPGGRSSTIACSSSAALSSSTFSSAAITLSASTRSASSRAVVARCMAEPTRRVISTSWSVTPLSSSANCCRIVCRRPLPQIRACVVGRGRPNATEERFQQVVNGSLTAGELRRKRCAGRATASCRRPLAPPYAERVNPSWAVADRGRRRPARRPGGRRRGRRCPARPDGSTRTATSPVRGDSWLGPAGGRRCPPGRRRCSTSSARPRWCSTRSGALVKTSPAAYAFGLVRGRDLVHPELREMAAEARDLGLVRERELELPRGPLGRGRFVVSARVAPLGDGPHADPRRGPHRGAAGSRRSGATSSATSATSSRPRSARCSLLAEAVHDAADDPDAVRHFAQRMQRESLRLSTLVQEIINLSRLQVGRRPARARAGAGGRGGRGRRRPAPAAGRAPARSTS